MPVGTARGGLIHQIDTCAGTPFKCYAPTYLKIAFCRQTVVIGIVWVGARHRHIDAAVSVLPCAERAHAPPGTEKVTKLQLRVAAVVRYILHLLHERETVLALQIGSR